MDFFTLTPKSHFSYLVYNCATVSLREWFQARVQCTLSASYGEFKMSGFLIGIYLPQSLDVASRNYSNVSELVFTASYSWYFHLLCTVRNQSSKQWWSKLCSVSLFLDAQIYMFRTLFLKVPRTHVSYLICPKQSPSWLQLQLRVFSAVKKEDVVEGIIWNRSTNIRAVLLWKIVRVEER